MALINDTIDQLSYEIGEASGYVDGSRTGYKQLLYFTKQKLWGVALLLLTFVIAYLANGDMSIGVITVPMSLILIFGKGRWIL